MSSHFYRAEGSAFPLLVYFRPFLLTHALVLSVMKKKALKCFFGFVELAGIRIKALIH